MTSPDRSPLEALLAAEGSVAHDPEPAWRDFVEHVVESLDVGPGTRIWDVGCGAGAFLYPLWENGYIVGGVDDSEDRIALARAAMPQGTFVVGEPSGGGSGRALGRGDCQPRVRRVRGRRSGARIARPDGGEGHPCRGHSECA